MHTRKKVKKTIVIDVIETRRVSIDVEIDAHANEYNENWFAYARAKSELRHNSTLGTVLPYPGDGVVPESPTFRLISIEPLKQGD